MTLISCFQVDPYRKDIYADGKVKLTPAQADEMLQTWNKNDDTEDYKNKKKAMSGYGFSCFTNLIFFVNR
jgi:hypothetical protein